MKDNYVENKKLSFKKSLPEERSGLLGISKIYFPGKIYTWT